MATTYYLSGISLIIQYLNNLGLLAQGAQLYTYVGGEVGTFVTTYTDSTGTVPNPNPMTLNGAARPASASGAPVAFWVPGGTIVQLLVNDAAGNQLVFLDNVPALNDLTSSSSGLQAQLASAASSNASGVGPVAGADLVANAVKSYDVFADVRAANEPQLTSGQTLNIEIQGGTAVNDGLGGFFYWNVVSTASDDGLTVLKPNSVAGANPGRWLRYYPQAIARSVVKPTDQSVASSTVLVNDTALTLTLPGVGTYLIQARLKLLSPSGTTQGWQVALAFSGGVQAPAVGGAVVSGNGTGVAGPAYIGTAVTNAAISATTGDVVNLDFVLTVTGTGALTVQFAQESSSANATVMKAGSALTAARIA